MANRDKIIVALMSLCACLMLGGCGPSLAKFEGAIESGNLKDVESMLAKKPELVNRDEGSYDIRTPLGIAASSGNKEMVEFLIAKGADINDRQRRWRGWRGETPLHCAVTGGHKEIVELLVAKGADINARDIVEGVYKTPLDLAEEKGHKEVADMLRKQTKDVEDIFKTVNEGNLSKVTSILEEKPELMLNTSHKENHTLLHQAAVDGHKEIAVFLIAKGASIDAKNKNHDTPLHSAVQGGHKDLVELLLADGADINMTGPDGYTPLHYAVEKQNIEIIKFLVYKGADINARTGRSSDSPLDIATIKDSTPIVKLLIANGAKVNSTDHEGWSALFFAAKEGHKEIAELLIAKGANVNAKEKKEHATVRDAKTRKMVRSFITNCESPLHVATRYAHKDIVEVLIANDANVNARALDYLTPLHIAAEKGHEEIVRILLENGAKVNAKTRKIRRSGLYYPAGATPLDLALQGRQKDVAELLRKHGAVE